MDRDKLLDAYHAAYDACYALINNYNTAFAQQEHNEDLIAIYKPQARNPAADEMHSRVTPYITEPEMRALDARIREVIDTAPDDAKASEADISSAKRAIDAITPSIQNAYDALLARNAALLEVLNAYKPRQPVGARLASDAIATLDAILCTLDDTKKKQ